MRLISLLLLISLPMGALAQPEDGGTVLPGSSEPMNCDVCTSLDAQAAALNRVATTLEAQVSEGVTAAVQARIEANLASEGIGLQHADLTFQEAMADFTGKLYLVGVAGLVISGLGIWLLVGNLKAVKNTNETMMMAERAFLSVHSADLHGIATNDPIEGVKLLGLTLRVDNKGRSLPTEATCIFHLSTIPADTAYEPVKSPHIANVIGSQNEPIDELLEPQNYKRPSFRIEVSTNAWAPIAAGEKHATIVGSIQYKDVFGKERYCEFGFRYRARLGRHQGGTCERLVDKGF